MVVRNFKEELSIVLASKNGQVKRTSLKEFELQRYTKPVKCFNLKDDDEVINVALTNDHQAIFLLSDDGYVNFYPLSSISRQGVKASGVRGITLKGESQLAGMICVDPLSKDSIFLLADKGGYKNLKISEVPVTNRAVRGIQVYKPVKSNQQNFIGAYLLKKDQYLQIMVDCQDFMRIEAKEVGYNALDSRLSTNLKVPASQQITFVYSSFYYKEENVQVVETFIQEEIQFETLSLDDFLN